MILDPDNLAEAPLDRMAFETAHRRLKLDRISMRHGYPDDTRRLGRLRAEVRREFGDRAGRALKVIELEIADALEKRQPRW